MNFGLFFLLHQSSIKSEHLIWYLILLFSHSLFVNPIVDPAFCTKHHVYTFSQKKSHLKLSISVAPRSSITHLQIFSLIDHIWISTMLPLLKASFLSSDCLASLCLYLMKFLSLTDTSFPSCGSHCCSSMLRYPSFAIEI